VWRQQAENVAESISRGDRVIVVGRLGQRQFEKDGERKSSYEIQAEDVGPALKNATAQVAKNGTQNGQQQRAQGYGQQAPQNGYGAPQGDPWNQQQRPQGYSAEPPF
jgi:single-strand DNA-binding protein